jgi:hypothetical protein
MRHPFAHFRMWILRRRSYKQMYGWPELLELINASTRHREADR